MFDAQRAKRPEQDQSPAEPIQKTSGTKQRTTQRTKDLTRMPLYSQGWGNQPPPWLRLPVQRKEPHEEEPRQERDEPPTQRKANTTGLPDTLKAGVEQLSGLSMNDVQVHYNSSKPAQVQALAYTQGTDIHVGPGQERHLPHEAWHVVQQRQGRVRPMMHTGGVMVNDDMGLEQEASAMGAQALRMKQAEGNVTKRTNTTASVKKGEQSGMHPLLAPQAPLVRTVAGAGAAPAVVHPPLQRIAADAPEWIDYRTSKNKLVVAWNAMEAHKAANNQGVRNEIVPSITQALLNDYPYDASNRYLLTKAEIQPRKLILDNLQYYADHYNDPAKLAQLAELDLYNIAHPAPSVQHLWKNWQNNWKTAQGTAKFDEVYNAIPTIAWNKAGGKAVPGTTKNPTISKYNLPIMQQAVLDGIKNNKGKMRKRFDRNIPHHTNPTTGGALGKGPHGKEYTAVGHIAPVGMPPAPLWYAIVNPLDPPGLKRFLHFQGYWFYSPTHYVIAGVATPLAYQLIIDA